MRTFTSKGNKPPCSSTEDYAFGTFPAYARNNYTRLWNALQNHKRAKRDVIIIAHAIMETIPDQNMNDMKQWQFDCYTAKSGKDALREFMFNGADQVWFMDAGLRRSVEGNGAQKKVKTEDAEKTMMVRYDKEGDIVHVDVKCGRRRRLVYMNFPDDEAAKETVYRFCSFEGERLCREAVKYGGKVSRVFIEKFYDGEAADFAVKMASPEEVAAVRAAGGDSAADNSGEYGSEKRIECDVDTWSAMILCGSPEFRADMFGFGAFIMQRAIEENALPKLNKAADFRFIVNEYD